MLNDHDIHDHDFLTDDTMRENLPRSPLAFISLVKTLALGPGHLALV